MSHLIQLIHSYSMYCVHNDIGGDDVPRGVHSPPQAAIDKPLKFPGSLDDHDNRITSLQSNMDNPDPLLSELCSIW